MKHFIASLFLSALVSPLSAQQTDIDQASELLVVPTGDKFLHWYGHADRSYFLQVSDATNPLAKWFWAPVIESGNDEEISYEVDGAASKGFFRLLHTTLPQPPGVTLEDWDADDDRLNNWEEIASHGSNPLKSDTDDDGLPDDWEIAHGLNPLDDGTEDPDRGPDAPFSSQSGDSQGAFALAALESPITNSQAFAAGVQAVPSATITDKDGDLIPDGEDADPLSLAVNWRKSSKPVYAAIPVPGWIPATHSFPVSLNNQNYVLTGRAVYQNGIWIPVTGHFSASGQGQALSYQFQIDGRLHPCRLGQCIINSISDQGEIMGTGKILIDPVTVTDPITGQVTTHTAGFSPDFGMIWRNPLFPPEIFGVAQGATLQGDRHVQSGVIHRDGTVLMSKRRPEDISLNNNAMLERWPNTANGGGVQTSPTYLAPTYTYPAVGGSFAFGSYLFTGQSLATLSWIWPANGAPQSLYTVTRSAPGATALNFQSSPTTIGTAPSGEACVNLSGQVLVGHSGRYHQVPSLQGATKISPHGAGLLPGTTGNPGIWFGGNTYPLNSCVSNPQALGTTLTVRDVNDDGSMLAIVNVNTANQKLVILMPIDIEEVISDQIAGNEANKLPTEFFGGQPNNPMLMATTSGAQADLAVKMNVPTTSRLKVRVGVRVVGQTTIIHSVTSNAQPEITNLSFSALPGSQMYEVVAGYDVDGSGNLDSSEVTTVFQKTPKTNNPSTGGGPYTGPAWGIVDKIIVVTHDDFVAARNATEGYGNGAIISSLYPTAARFISGFAQGANTIPGSSAPELGALLDAATIPSNQGLSHPLGGKWNTLKQTTTHKLVLPSGSDLSDDVIGSQGIRDMYARALNQYKSTIMAGVSSTWTVVTISFTDDKIDFAASDQNDQVHVALGKCKFIGSLEVSARLNSGGGIDVQALNCYGYMEDLYDFAYGAPKVSAGGIDIADPKEAARTQAGYATLTFTPWPDAGRVFFTKVEFGTGWFPYAGSYTP